MLKKFALLLLVVVLTACNFPTRQAPLFEATLQTGLIQTAGALTAAAPLPTPVPLLIQQPAPPVYQLPQPDLPAPVVQPVGYAPLPQTGLPVLSVSVNTNCRSGPAQAYSLIGWLLVGEQAVIVGQNQALNYYVIQNPRGAGNCWLWGQYATVYGDLSSVPHVDFPAATPGVPVTGQPYLGVSVATNCRTGPAPQYPIQAVLQPGQFAYVLGRNATSSWWLIQHPAVGAQCWVWGGYAFVNGNIAAVPVIPVSGPAPVTPQPPPAPTTPILAVSVNTNCRVGPSPQNPIISYLLVGQYAPVLGRTFDAAWWLIQNPNQPGLTCWVWGKYATLWGDFGSIPVVPPTGVTPLPPTPVPPTPIPPTPVPPTPVAGLPYLTVSVNTNCRNAPSPRYPAVGTLLPGQLATIYGRNTPGDWWYVQLPTFPEVQCWVWGQNASVYGDTSQVPILPVAAALGLTSEPDPPDQFLPQVPQEQQLVPLQPTIQPVIPEQPQQQPIVPNAPRLLSTPEPQMLPQINPIFPDLPLFRTATPPQTPPEILIQPVNPTPPFTIIQPVIPTPAPELVQPAPIIQPTPVPPVIQPLEPVLSTPIPPALIQPGTSGAEECIVLNQAVPFGQTYSANTPFEASWTVLNTGSATWNPGEVSARYLSGSTLHTSAEVQLLQPVQPGSMVNITVPMIAPANPQGYSTAWAITRGTQVLCNLIVAIEVQ